MSVRGRMCWFKHILLVSTKGLGVAKLQRKPSPKMNVLSWYVKDNVFFTISFCYSRQQMVQMMGNTPSALGWMMPLSWARLCRGQGIGEFSLLIFCSAQVCMFHDDCSLDVSSKNILKFCMLRDLTDGNHFSTCIRSNPRSKIKWLSVSAITGLIAQV